MPRRSKFFEPLIVSSETEHAVYDPTKPVSTSSDASRVWKYSGQLRRYGRNTKSSWRGYNGSRPYVDANSKAEFAAPECTNGTDVSYYETGGSILWARAAALADRADLHQTPKTYVFKTNTSHNGDSAGGSHLNFGMPKSMDGGYNANLNFVVPQLKALIVALQVLFGAGTIIKPARARPAQVDLGSDEFGFAIAARGFHVTRNVGYASNSCANGDKPIFLHRDEPHADSRRFWRMQICGLDSNILSIDLKMDILQLCCMMAAWGRFRPVLIKEPPEKECRELRELFSMRAVSLNWRARLDVEGPERSMTSEEILWHYFKQARAFVRLYPTEARMSTIARWEWMLRQLATDAPIPYGNFGKSDWVTKYVMLEQRAARIAVSHDRLMTLQDAERVHFEYQGYIVQAKGLCLPLRLAVRFGEPGLLQNVMRCMVEAPRDTRAWGRGEVLRLYPHELSMSWDAVSALGTAVKLDDPTVPMNGALAAAMERWRTLMGRD